MERSLLYFVIWKENRHYVSQRLNVDVSSFGKSKEEAIKNLNEALELYFEDSLEIDHEMLEAHSEST